MELRIQLRRPFVWFCFVGFFALAFSDTVRAGWGGEGQFWINGAAIIGNRAIILSLTGVVAVAGIMCDPMARDRIYGAEEMVLATPAQPRTLGLAKFCAAFLVLVASTAMFAPGIMLGARMPGIPEELVGPLAWAHYGKALAYFLIPNYLLTSALIFAVSARWQSRAIAFGAGIGAIALWTTTRMSLGRDVLRQEVFKTYALLDPFGTIASWEFSTGRTVTENNTLFAPLAGTLLANRLIWSLAASGLVVLGLAVAPLRPRLVKARRKTRGARHRLGLRLSQSPPTSGIGGETAANSARPSWLRTLVSQVAWEFRLIWRQPATKICIAFLVLTIWRSAASTATYQFSLPSTDLLVHTTSYFLDKVLVLTIVWSAGELMWRDRALRVAELVDAQPATDTVRFLSKTLTLFGIVAICWMLSIGVNAAYQAAHGYYRFEWGLYFVDSFVFKAPYYLWLAVLALACQAVFRNRYVAMGVVLLIYMSELLLDAAKVFHPMLRYGRVSHFYYSLMDGYGHSWWAHIWTSLYWTTAAAIVGILGWASFYRGTNPPSRRWYWRRKLAAGQGGRLLGIALIAFVAVGAYVWHQSTVLATWPPLNEDRVDAQIERKYKADWQRQPQPCVVRIEGDLQLYPAERRFELTGAFTIENQSDQPIVELLIPAHPLVTVEEIDLGADAVLVQHDRELNIQHWRLGNPLPPGERMAMRFRTSGAPSEGFAVHAKEDNIPEVSQVEIIGNGTSLLNLRLMPGIGYTDRVEVKPAWKRRRLGLPEDWSAPAGALARRQGHALLHLGWVESIDMTIHTAADQTAVHAGELVESGRDPNGRRFFRYRVDRPSRGWSQVASARYQVREFTREGLPDVVVYYDPQHEPSVDFFANSIHDAMAYFAERYGPPPFETYRLVEQSLHYDGFGSRGGIGFSSEVLGWKTDIAAHGGEDIKRMAALMMGMSWWGDQVIPANVAGAKMIHSGLPYWSAALYLHATRPPATDRRLRLQAMQEMFRGRSSMVDKEGPFVEEFKDSTLVRNKGSLSILYLAEAMNADKFESALAEFLRAYRYRAAPYPTGAELVEHLRTVAPAELQQAVADQFEHVTVWRFAVKSARCEPLPDDRWRLTAVVDARKFYTSGWGDQTEQELNTPVTLAAFVGGGFDDDAVIWRDSRPLESGESEIVVELDQRPTRFGIDPHHLLPDPNPFDNVRQVD